MGLFDWLFGKRRQPPPTAQGGPGGAGSSELDGVWKVVSWEMGGQAVEVHSRYDRVVIQQDRYVAFRGDESVGYFLLRVDGSRHPGQIDLTDPPGEVPFLGIYAREGDRLRLCWDGNRPGSRPTTFSGEPPCVYLGLLGHDAYRAEAAGVEGEWAVLEMEENGARVPDGTRCAAVEFAGDRLILTRPDQARLVMTFSLNPLTSPRSLEIVAEAGDGRVFYLAGIYALEGDRLRLCYNDSGHGRPAGFGTSAQVPAASFLLKRAKVPHG